MKKKEKIIILALLIIIIILAGIAAIVEKTRANKETSLVTNEDETENELDNLVVEQQPKEVQIFKGTDRPIAVMIDNHNGAWPQAGLDKAYLVYEIIVEGGETRLMALFKGAELDVIGPVRSSRHYFLDYALENDAIYVHYGWSPQAQSDISSLKVNNVNGMVESSSSFWRTNKKSAPHNAMTKTEKIIEIAERRKYSLTSTKKSVLKYVAEEFELENGIDALEVTIPHSNLQTVQYKYDEETKRYTRYARNKVQTTFETGDEITTKNIIITFCDNYTLNDTENKGRQGLKNIGTFKGYYITNGKAIEIECTKSSRIAQTIYKDLEGNEIDVNDGNTFIHICPTKANVVIK